MSEDAPPKRVISLPSDTSTTTGKLSHIDGSFKDPTEIKELADTVDILTVEIEYVEVDALEQVQQSTKVEIHPSPGTITLIQDKYRQKEHLEDKGCPISNFVRVDSTVKSVTDAAERLGLPLMLKSRTLAYDGRGNYVLKGLERT